VGTFHVFTAGAPAVAALPTAQVMPGGPPNIVVSSYGVASAPAETARIQFLVGLGTQFKLVDEVPKPDITEGQATEDKVAVVVEGPVGVPGDTLAFLQLVAKAISATGVAPDRIEAVTAAGFADTAVTGAGGGLIEVMIDQPTKEGVAAIVDAAATAAAGSLFMVSVQYDVADCTPLIQQARQAAVDQARAEALGGTVGGVLQVSAFAVTGVPAGTRSQGCTPAPPFDYLIGGGPFTMPLVRRDRARGRHDRGPADRDVRVRSEATVGDGIAAPGHPVSRVALASRR
jgi:hypothetical protein